MKKKYKITFSALILILIFILGCFIYSHFQKNDSVLQDYSEVYVDENLSFNFMEGKNIDTNEEDTYYHFSIINTSNDMNSYRIMIDGGNSDGAIFEFSSDQNGFQSITNNYPNGSIVLADSVEILGNTTHNYTLHIKNEKKSHVFGTIEINKNDELNTFAHVIMKNNPVKEAITTVGVDIATEDEGLIKSTDDDGECYYFRGNVSNNYVSFAGYLWRIVKINGDGSIKLILNELNNNNAQFYAKDHDFNLSFDQSVIFSTLNAWYESNLKEYDSSITNAKFCSDTSYDEHGYSSFTRLYTNHTPIFECLGDTVASKVGLLTADEVILAGANSSSPNTSFYLYQENIKTSWWTMSIVKNINGTYQYIEMNQNGLLNQGTNGTLFRGSRPVINLIRKTTVTGTGTMDDPYIVG